MSKPDALQLADWLDDQYDPTHNLDEAASELRRLHDENQTLESAYQSACNIVQEQDAKLVELEGQRDALLEAMANIERSTYDAMTAALARAAIKAAEEKA